MAGSDDGEGGSPSSDDGDVGGFISFTETPYGWSEEYLSEDHDDGYIWLVWKCYTQIPGNYICKNVLMA